MKKLVVLTMFAALVLTAGTALALDNTSVDVSAIIAGVCTINAGGPIVLNFGATIDPTTFVDTTINDALTFRCTNGVNYSIDLGGVAAPAAGTDLARTMLGGAGLPYTLTPQSDPNGVSPGTAVDITYSVNATLTAAAVQAAAAGAYAESINLQINP
jgi:hypothetical protein